MSEHNEAAVLAQHYEPGWVDDPAAVDKVVAELPLPVFSDTPAYAMTGAPPQQVFLWKAYEAVFGAPFPSGSQGRVGSCVSWGGVHAAIATLAAKIFAGSGESPYWAVQEALYGLSRVEIGKRQLGRGDGSIGAWAAKAAVQYGLLPRGVYLDGKYDLTKYSEDRCRDWGWNGLPDALEPIAREFPVKETSLVTTLEELDRCLANGWAVSICSNQGFTLSRDKDGFCVARGRWAHCMCVIGYQKGGKPGYFILNSWGADAYSGPIGAGDGPKGGFWCDAETMQRILNARDSFAFIGTTGAKPTNVDWSTL